MKRCVLAILLLASCAFPRYIPLEFQPTDTGLVKADFTLLYLRWDFDLSASPHLSTTALSTSGITVYEAGSGVYGFDGLTDDDTHYYLFRATITSSGHRDERWFPAGGPAPLIQQSAMFTAPTENIYWRGDTPVFSIEVAGYDCHGMTAEFSLKNQGSGTAKVLTGTTAISNYGLLAGCDVAFNFSAADTGMTDCAAVVSTCGYWGQFTLTWTDTGKIQSTARYPITVRRK